MIFCELMTGKHPFQLFELYQTLVKEFENLDLVQKTQKYLDLHRMDHYLLDLPEVFNVESLDLLSILLQAV